MSVGQSHYDVLGVAPDAAPKAITKAFRKLARRYHPDHNPQGAEKFKLIEAAYSVLKDPKKRAAYDDELKRNSGQRRSPLVAQLVFDPPVADFGDMTLDGRNGTIFVRAWNVGKMIVESEGHPAPGKHWGTFWALSVGKGNWNYGVNVKLVAEFDPDMTIGHKEDSVEFKLGDQLIGELKILVNIVDETAPPAPLYPPAAKYGWRRRGALSGVALCLAIVAGLAYLLWPSPAAPYMNVSAQSSPSGMSYNSIQQHNEDVIAIAVDPHGNIASAGLDGSVFVSEPNGTNEQTLAPPMSLSGPSAVPTAVSYSADGKYLAVGYAGGTVQVFDPADLQDGAVGTATVTGNVNDLSFSQAGGDETLAVATQDGEAGSLSILRVGSDSDPQTVTTLSVGGPAAAVAFSGDGRHAAVVNGQQGKSQAVEVWDIESRQRVAAIRDASALAVSFSADGQTLAIEDDTSVQLWSVSKQAVTKVIQHASLTQMEMTTPHMVAFSPVNSDLLMFVTSGKSGSDALGTVVDIYDMSDDRQLAALTVDTYVFALAFDPRGTLLSTGGGAGIAASGYGDNHVHVWNLNDIRE